MMALGRLLSRPPFSVRKLNKTDLERRVLVQELALKEAEERLVEVEREAKEEGTDGPQPGPT